MMPKSAKRFSANIMLSLIRTAPLAVKFRSERTDRKIAQPHVGEAAALPQPEQRPVESLPQRLVAAPHRDADVIRDLIDYQ